MQPMNLNEVSLNTFPLTENARSALDAARVASVLEYAINQLQSPGNQLRGTR